jgi:hypothetical protein
MTRSLPVTALAALLLCGLSVHSQSGDEDFHLMNSESIGALRISMPAAQVKNLIAGDATRSKIVEWDADGKFHQTWTYSALGLEIGMESDSRGSVQTIERISVKAPSQLQTKLGIHVGSPETDVLKIYHSDISTDESKIGEEIVAGSIYGGLMFEIKQGLVTHILLGAVAE